ncbi:hypothetical protein SLEP1_g47931 [Rubroshorea leprosula]|uniref:Uncharacterized protein n=1 Tax=Rubroshorea leprosula TaxID=152421 RepID=A0AAV5LS64_9ROSI|nr:hypothetical protein SLEP1_g47931 [Rubroshorea leprosula]
MAAVMMLEREKLPSPPFPRTASDLMNPFQAFNFLSDEIEISDPKSWVGENE